jgi:hypothetical protein
MKKKLYFFDPNTFDDVSRISLLVDCIKFEFKWKTMLSLCKVNLIYVSTFFFNLV